MDRKADVIVDGIVHPITPITISTTVQTFTFVVSEVLDNSKGEVPTSCCLLLIEVCEHFVRFVHFLSIPEIRLVYETHITVDERSSVLLRIIHHSYQETIRVDDSIFRIVQV